MTGSMARGTSLTLSLLYHEQNSGLRSLQPLFIDAQPGKMSLPALPRLVVPNLLGSDGPPFGISYSC